MNIFVQFFKSIYSPKDIASFRLQGIGKTILYVFLLSAISVFPTIYFSNTAIKEAVSVIEETIKEDLPDFQIENGLLTSTENEPILITKGDFSIIFDSSGTMDTSNVTTGDTLALLKQEMVLIAGGEANSIPYSMLGAQTTTKQEIETFIDGSDSALAIFLPIFSLAIYLFTSGIGFIEISIIALFGLLLKNLVGKPLQYRHLWRMAAYSVTLPTVFFTIMSLLQVHVPFGSLINWFVSLTVLLLAIQEVPHSKEPELVDNE
ncbi:Maltodextrin utilization protein YvdJ [Mesobacillus persicus]|uniref:Maltodextrin utilization protein YvdJ n=1 Tax=Mesobacillus persicus TaxID=930146 RepID=A0A1H7X5K9_9BACI|nr:DUF1189 domain-containing protein [Mesobacillus persicus]SEM29003.1 Maltodextrin utilization protein YvdJ [Mesobacillus persicus]